MWKNGRVEVCPNEHGNRITPSYVAWDSSGQQLVGDAAKNQATSNPTNTVFDAKRLMYVYLHFMHYISVHRIIYNSLCASLCAFYLYLSGRKFSDPIVQKDAKLFPFKCKFRLLGQSVVIVVAFVDQLLCQYLIYALCRTEQYFNIVLM